MHSLGVLVDVHRAVESFQLSHQQLKVGINVAQLQEHHVFNLVVWCGPAHRREGEERGRDQTWENADRWTIEIVQINSTQNRRAIVMNADAVKVSPLMIRKASVCAGPRYCRPQACVTALHSSCSLAQNSWPRHVNHSCSYCAVPQPRSRATSRHNNTWTIAEHVKSESASQTSELQTRCKILHHSSNVVKLAASFITQHMCLFEGRWKHWFLNTRDKTAIIAAVGVCVVSVWEICLHRGENTNTCFPAHSDRDKTTVRC